MDDARFVRGFERVGDLAGDVQGFVERNGAFGDALEERRAFDDLHYEIVGADVVQGADVRVIEGSDGSGFALESLGEAVGGNLDRDFASEARIAGAIDLAHATRADERENLVRTEFLADGR